MKKLIALPGSHTIRIEVTGILQVFNFRINILYYVHALNIVLYLKVQVLLLNRVHAGMATINILRKVCVCVCIVGGCTDVVPVYPAV